MAVSPIALMSAIFYQVYYCLGCVFNIPVARYVLVYKYSR